MIGKYGFTALLAAAAFIVTGATAAHATETLIYTGNAFTASGFNNGFGDTTGQPVNTSIGSSLDLTLVLPVAQGFTGNVFYEIGGGPSLALDSFSANVVGSSISINDANVIGGEFVLTLANGLPTSWSINIGDFSNAGIQTSVNGDEAGIQGNNFFNYNSNSPGTWSIAWAMMLAGFGLIGATLRLGRRKALSTAI